MTAIPPSIHSTAPSGRNLGELLGIERPSGETGPQAPHRLLPLQRVVAKVTIVGDCARTELEEHYSNPHDVPLDVLHTIPLPAGGAVTDFEIRAGGRTVRGHCRRRDEAESEHADARQRGKTTALVTQVRDDLHRISLANVPPKSEVVVRLQVVERLRVDDGRLEFRFPTALSPKYVPGVPIGHRGDGTSADTLSAPDASRLTPPVLLEGGIPLELEVSIAPGITDVRGSIALLRTDAADGSIALRPDGAARCAGDVVLRFWARGERAELRAFTDGERTLVTVDPPATRVPKLERPREAIFVLDRSGSMGGGRIAAAKRALAAALRALSARDLVQVVAFSTELQAFPGKPEPATARTVAKVVAWLEGIIATGGTKVMPALQFACTCPPKAGYVRTVLLVTDGDVANDEEILAFTRDLDLSTRLSVVGVGHAPSAGFIGRLARLGGGTHVMVRADEDVEREILRFESSMHGPIACGLHEEGTADSPGVSLARTDLFAGRATAFFLEGARDRVCVASADGKFRSECRVQRSPMPLGALWARDEVERLEDRRIAQPEEAREIDARIEALGLAHRIQTRATAFVAVDEASQVHGDAIELVQPVPAPEDHAQAAIAAFRMVVGAERGSSGNAKHNQRRIDGVRRSRLQWFLDSDQDQWPAPVVTLLGGTRGLPAALHVREGWVRLSMEELGDADTEDRLRSFLAEFEIQLRCTTEGLPPDATVARAVMILIMLLACSERRIRRNRLPEALRAKDLGPDGLLWRQCMALVAAQPAHPEWDAFRRALRRGDLKFAIRAAGRAMEVVGAAGGRDRE